MGQKKVYFPPKQIFSLIFVVLKYDVTNLWCEKKEKLHLKLVLCSVTKWQTSSKDDGFKTLDYFISYICLEIFVVVVKYDVTNRKIAYKTNTVQCNKMTDLIRRWWFQDVCDGSVHLAFRPAKDWLMCFNFTSDNSGTHNWRPLENTLQERRKLGKSRRGKCSPEFFRNKKGTERDNPSVFAHLPQIFLTFRRLCA